MPRASFAGRIFVGNEGDALGVAHQDVQKCSETGFLRRGAVFFRLFAEKLAAQALDLIDSDLELFPTGMLGANSAREREREREISARFQAKILQTPTTRYFVTRGNGKQIPFD